MYSYSVKDSVGRVQSSKREVTSSKLLASMEESTPLIVSANLIYLCNSRASVLLLLLLQDHACVNSEWSATEPVTIVN